jgi:2-dehydropantoate 2-reductase
MKIAVAGSGAMGASFGFLLAEVGNEVILIDGWEDQVETIKEKGLTFEMAGTTTTRKMNIYYPQEVKKHASDIDLVILFTKAMQLDDMLKEIKFSLTGHTQVLCLLNGMGHEQIVAQYVPKENFLLGNTLWSASLVKPGAVKLHPGGNVNLKNMAPNRKEEALKIIDVLNKAKLNANYAEEIMTSIYKKLCTNASFNGLCTLFDSTVAEFGNTAPSKEIVSQIVSEIIAVAKVEDVELSYDEMMAIFETVCDPTKMGGHYPSMHQDLVKNLRRTEVDYINGVIAKKGQKYGIPTPYNQLITKMIHTKEELLNAK